MNFVHQNSGNESTRKQKRITALLEAAVKSHQNSNFAEARVLYSQARKSDPKNVIALQLSGVLAAHMEENDLSLNFFTRAIAQNPRYSEAYFNRGNLHKKLKNFEKAASDYETAISINPKFVESWYNYGVALCNLGNYQKALDALDEAIRLNPVQPQAFFSRGIALKELGHSFEAIEAYQVASKIDPLHTDAHFNIACIFAELGQYHEAIEWFDKVIDIDPSISEAFSNRAGAFQQLGDFEKALSDYNNAISLEGNNVYSRNNRGTILKEMGRYKEALSDYDAAIQLNPQFAEAFYNRGMTNSDLNNDKEAIKDYTNAISIDQSNFEAFNNRGNISKKLGHFEEALSDYNKAISLNPSYAEAYNNRGGLMSDMKRYEDALLDYDKAISLNPNHASAHWNKAIHWLRMANFELGWSLYEWRWKSEKQIGKPLETSKPIWNGQSNKRVLVWPEQGIGDEIMFGSIIPDLEKLCSKVIIQCDERLIPLFRRSFPEGVDFFTRTDSIPEGVYDSHIPFGSLPMLLRPTLESFHDSSGPYLLYDGEKTKNLRKKLVSDDSQQLIGLSWHSNSILTGAQHRNINIEKLAQLLNRNNFRLVNLQYGDVSDELEDLRLNYNIDVLQVPEIDNHMDIDGLAALIGACDHVVSIDNATVHLASALGKPTHVLLPFNCDWRWGLNGSKSYWYKSTKLYRQEHMSDWAEAFESLSINVTKS
jgi:tetratricopeptide (TPR) repeat protein